MKNISHCGNKYHTLFFSLGVCSLLSNMKCSRFVCQGHFEGSVNNFYQVFHVIFPKEQRNLQKVRSNKKLTMKKEL